MNDPEVRSVSHVAEFSVGATNAFLRPGELVTVKGDGVHPRCGGPSDGVIVRQGTRGKHQVYRAGALVLVAMLNSGGDSVISVRDPREQRRD